MSASDSSYGYQAPDLASIFRTLSALSLPGLQQQDPYQHGQQNPYPQMNPYQHATYQQPQPDQYQQVQRDQYSQLQYDTYQQINEHQYQLHQAQQFLQDQQIHQDQQVHQSQKIHQDQQFEQLYHSEHATVQDVVSDPEPTLQSALQALARVSEGGLKPEPALPLQATGQVTPPYVPKIDPTTIVEWSAGLRFATRLFASNEQYENRVRKMIAGEREHIEQWWAGREALIKKQEGRVAGKQQLMAVLRSIGGEVSTETVENDDAAELKRYDTKVYRAQTDMVNAMSTDLAAMGVPFFGTKSYLIREGTSDGTNTALANDGSQAKLFKSELKGLQKQMLKFLEDMFKG